MIFVPYKHLNYRSILSVNSLYKNYMSMNLIKQHGYELAYFLLL